MSTHFLWSNSYKLFENKRGFTEFLIEQVKHNSKIFASVEQIICFSKKNKIYLYGNFITSFCRRRLKVSGFLSLFTKEKFKEIMTQFIQQASKLQTKI